VFVATEIKPANTEKYLYIKWLNCYTLLAEEWLEKEKVEFINGV
jgi:hypothetical protein